MIVSFPCNAYEHEEDPLRKEFSSFIKDIRAMVLTFRDEGLDPCHRTRDQELWKKVWVRMISNEVRKMAKKVEQSILKERGYGAYKSTNS